ncbi:hypothetical protein O181_062161 [Austropuccinia psidii MF-1]|uniref:Uncharacterized protein n=1 Tax=Austropuccinia psidii MF-1 TaxID=1389203 RepID=A0A9Q3HY74_9BASI|nr:hypothetical protein [Austropuccinia psidii MF-1]
MDEPPIPGPSPSSKPHEDVPNCEPEPEVASTQSMEEPFGKSQISLMFPSTISSLSHSVITIDNTPVGSPPPHSACPTPPPSPFVPPRSPPPHPLIPTMTPARNLLT